MISLPFMVETRFLCRELVDSDLYHLSTFGMTKKHLKAKAGGVLDFLRTIDGKGNVFSQALEENLDNNSRTYLVIDKKATKNDLCAYFTLKPGLVPFQIEDESFNTVSGVELVNFAVNAKYRATPKNKIGAMTFSDCIMPLVKEVQTIVGAQFLYLYALPIPKLIKTYKDKYLFRKLPSNQEEFVCSHVRPKYDNECIFMYQRI